jgi:hypothetical protein
MPMLLSTDTSPKAPYPVASPDQRDLNRLWDRYDFSMHSGRRYAEVWGRVRVAVEDDQDSPSGLTDFFQTVPFAIVSARFVELLRAFGAGCEYLPLQIRYRNSLISDQYFALNVLTFVAEAVDRPKSKFSCYEPDILEDVELLALKEGALGHACIARLPEICRIAVSDDLAKALQDSGMRGFALTSPALFRS